MPFGPAHVSSSGPGPVVGLSAGLLAALPCPSSLCVCASVHRSQQSQDFKTHVFFVKPDSFKEDMLRRNECSGMTPWEIGSSFNCETK